LYQRTPSEKIKLLSPETTGFMMELLGDVVKSGTGRRAFVPGRTLGGKTGTSQGNRDAWFIGGTPEMTIGVWMGNDDYTPMDKTITGGTVPADIFKEIVK